MGKSPQEISPAASRSAPPVNSDGQKGFWFFFEDSKQLLEFFLNIFLVG